MVIEELAEVMLSQELAMGIRAHASEESEIHKTEKNQVEQRSINKLVKDKQYEQIAKLLKFILIPQHDSDSYSIFVLNAAHQITLVCQQILVEKELHQQAYFETIQREQELQQQLKSLLNIIDQYLEPGDLSTDVDLKVPEEQSLMADNIVEDTAVPLIPRKSPTEQLTPILTIYCLGTFQVYADDKPVEDWVSKKGKSIFKYLLTHRQRPINKEVLMNLFWPNIDQDSARNNLNVAIHSLRQTLRRSNPGHSHILFQDDAYVLNPEIQIWIDVETYKEKSKRAKKIELQGNIDLAMREYHAAEALYKGQFLADDRYEEWALPLQQQLETHYLRILDRLSRYYLDREEYDTSAVLCEKMLAVDPCREEAHRRLMRYYDYQKQHYLALRQFHLCAEALSTELDVDPSQATKDLYLQIYRGR